MFIAAKLWDIFIFTTEKLVEYTDYTYTVQQIIERTVLITLKFDIGRIVVAHYVHDLNILWKTMTV